LFLLIFSSAHYAQESCNKVEETLLSISFCAPTGWTSEVDSEGDLVLTGEKVDGLTPNIIITSEKVSESLAEYDKSQIEFLLKNYKQTGASSMELKSQASFKAADSSGFKSVFKCIYQGTEIWIIQYRFSGKGDTKILFNVSIPAVAKNKLEKSIDDAMATFKVSNKGSK
jgi:hypothetical protein